jgi:hypothetical protein
MLTRLIFVALFLSAASRASATPIGYTVNGTGGLSPAIAGVSDSAFWWTNTAGSVPGSVLTSYGLDSFIPADQQGAGVFSAFSTSTSVGGLLLSSPFTLAAGQSLTLDYTVATIGDFTKAFNEMGFAALLQNGVVVAILGEARPDGGAQISDTLDPPQLRFAVSPGVTETIQSRVDQPDFALGGVQYGEPLDNVAGQCGHVGSCTADVSSSYAAAGAGTYQFLFGALTFDARHDPDLLVAVTNVTVPEPETALLLALGAIVMFRSRPRTWSART